MTYVFAFDHKHRRAPMDMKDLLGGKGANLAEMTSVLGLPVPAGFTISTDACRAYMHGGWPSGLSDEVAKHVTKLEKKMGRTLAMNPGSVYGDGVLQGAVIELDAKKAKVSRYLLVNG